MMCNIKSKVFLNFPPFSYNSFDTFSRGHACGMWVKQIDWTEVKSVKLKAKRKTTNSSVLNLSTEN
jgi:hypothetical protein